MSTIRPSQNPYLIDGPALISFSGGRTSGFMLAKIVEAHGGTLPVDVCVATANTGRELEETLRFIQRCSEFFGVHIQLLEYDPEAEHSTRLVSHNSASRNGEPFDALIKARKMLPNPVIRFCTIEMKIRRFDRYCRHWLGWDRWISVVGLRADEMHRVDKQRVRNALGKDRWFTAMPLADARVTKQDVKAFWERMPFDLELDNVNGSTPEGNCDLCFLKSQANIRGIMRRRPEVAEWWIRAEANAPGFGTIRSPEMALFRADRPSYQEMFNNRFDLFDGTDDEQSDCACTD